EQHFEEHEEVEEIAGEEGAVEAHQQQQEQAVEMRGRRMPARGREGQRSQRQNRGQDDHERRQAIGDKDDAEWRRPVAEHIGDGVRSLAVGTEQQEDRDGEQHRRRGDADRGLGRLVLDHDESGPREQREQDGHDRQMLQEAFDHQRPRPSTWSVPVRPREASSTTRNSAVMAKPITIAVRTSAWGTGSVYIEGSTSPAFSMTGAALTRRRPMEKMNKLTA